ncbi:uncharacterized protein LOC107042418 [Diachasma alloeum]|uniref:uncharacterized protein LOC107042418 n=1 Tax=Diachasma alloeum TaxID=454923 RepID=UPI0007383036|nr:uncharacterized protein LOC107042418 [Diachasma alloeum]
MSRRTLGKRINKMHHENMNTVKRILAKQTHVCTTADVGSNSSHRYLGVSVHWIDDDTLKQILAAIACRRFPGSHSFDQIADQLESIHNDFGLVTNKIVATVTDNATNFAKAVKKFGVIYMDMNS